MTREHGMTFREDMVAAIRSGRKTQTRRLMDPQPIFTSDGGAWYPPLDVERGKNLHYGNEDHFRRGVVIDFCPWQVGDRIYVQEEWLEWVGNGAAPNELSSAVLLSTAREDEALCDELFLNVVKDKMPIEHCGRKGFPPNKTWIGGDGQPRAGWEILPAKCMPSWIARTWLEVVKDPFPQRIRDISEADAQAEGANAVGFRSETEGIAGYECRIDFNSIWESLYPGSWERNEYVWVLDFKLIEGKGGAG